MPELSRYLNIRSAGGAAFTADDRRVVFLTNITGIPQAWSVAARGGWPDQLTFSDNRVAAIVASPYDAEVAVFERDDGGDERMQVTAIRPDGTDERPLVSNADAIHRFGDFGPDGTWFTFASNERNGVDFDLYRGWLDGGPAAMITELGGWVIPGEISPSGRWGLVTVVRSNMDSDVVIVDLDSGDWRVITRWDAVARNAAAGFGGSEEWVYVVSDRDGEFDQAYRVDVETGVGTRFGPAGWDVTGLTVRSGTGALVVNEDGRSRLHIFDPNSLNQVEEIQVPLGVVAGLSLSSDGGRLTVTISGAAHNPDVWIADTGRLDLTRLTESSTAGIDPGSFVVPELERIRSFDELSIPVWVYRPKAVDRPPVVVSVHGGPEAQELPGFNPIYQFLLASGYAVVAPNVRGSAGYGRAYLELDDLGKRWDAIADLAAVGEWVRGRSDLDGSRMAVMGGSYGGFMVLSALASRPDLWAAGVDIVGIANLVTFLENTGAYRRALREAEYGSLAEDRRLLEQLSPINRVDEIVAPLLVIHGANDPRVPLSEATQIVDRLNELGRPVHMLVFEDEGHGIVKLDNRKVAYGAVVEFLAEHLT